MVLSTTTKRRRRVATAALAAAALALASCAGTDDAAIATDTSTDAAVESSTEPSTAESAPAEVEPSGDFLSGETFVGQATSIDGQSVDLAGLADKDLILWFWAPW